MNLSKVLVKIIYVSSFAILLFMFLSFPLGGYTFFSDSLPSASPSMSLPTSLPLFFFGQLFYINLPFNITLGEAFTALWVLYLSFFTISFFGPQKGILETLRDFQKEGPSALFFNTALMIAVIFPIFALGLVSIEDLLNRIGLPVGQLPEIDPRENFFLITYSPLVEEFGFRVSLVGIAGGILGWKVLGGLKGFLKGIWHPASVIKSKGMGFKVNAFLLPIILNSLLFGLAHIFYSSDWGIGKVISAGIAGFIIGIVYVTNGVPAAILLHWAFNYFSATFYYFDRMRGLPPITENISNVFSYTQAFVDILIITSALLSLIALSVSGKKVKKEPT